MTAEPTHPLSYSSIPRRRSGRSIEALATAIAFFGAIATAGGILLAAGIEWFNATFLLMQTHSAEINLHLVSLGLAGISIVGILSTASGCCMTARKARRLSLGVAVAQFLVFPVGTAIAATTFILLSGESARALYRGRARGN